MMKRLLVFLLLLVLVALTFGSVENTRDPEQKYRECLERCKRRHEGQSFQERCHDECKMRRKQAEERREQEKGDDPGREEEQQKEEERERQQREEEREKQQRQEQRRQEERAREEEKRAREEEKRGREEEEEWRKHEKGGGGGGRKREGQPGEKEEVNLINDTFSREKRQEKEKEEKSSQEGNKNPYVFEDEHFRTTIRNQYGRERVLPKFTERSNLLKGIQNYRLLIAEAEPQTFILPKHEDADTVVYVAQGKGTVSVIRQNKRESFNIKRGDVAVIPSGSTAYVINPSNNEKLIVAKLVIPVNTPGRFEYFFGAGGEEPESFYRAFTTEILEAALNTKKEKFTRIFGQQKQGEFVKASEEQIKRLSQHEEEGGVWPFKGESKNKVNIFQQQPIQSNQYGKLYEVDGSKLRQLQDLDVAVAVTNISQGSMSTLIYNSRATRIAIVSNGEGYMEMACPHLSQSQESRQEIRKEQQGQQSPNYQKVSARLKRGVVVVIPAGHPHVVVASENQNLEIVSFEINTNNNERFPLAGRQNVINRLERTAKDLAFGVPAREVEEVFRNQKEDFFFEGPNRKQHRSVA